MIGFGIGSVFTYHRWIIGGICFHLIFIRWISYSFFFFLSVFLYSTPILSRLENYVRMHSLNIIIHFSGISWKTSYKSNQLWNSIRSSFRLSVFMFICINVYAAKERERLCLLIKTHAIIGLKIELTLITNELFCQPVFDSIDSFFFSRFILDLVLITSFK